jgi:hypothetical protein
MPIGNGRVWKTRGIFVGHHSPLFWILHDVIDGIIYTDYYTIENVF